MNKFKWAYIGCGGIAQITAAELIQTADNEITAVWNRTREKAEKFAEIYGGQVYDTALEAIRAPEVEGVYINVNGDQHAYFTRLCLEAGKPVLCEKPFTENAAVTRELFNYAHRQKVYVSEAMWTWHNKPALKVKDWIQSQAIGDMEDVVCAFEIPLLEQTDNPRLTTPEMLGGALLDLGIYTIRYIYELFGPPLSIQCAGHMEEVDLSDQIVMNYGNFKATLLVSMEKEGGHYFEAKGTKGSIHVPYFHAAHKAILEVEGQTEAFTTNDLLYGQQFSNVAEEIRSGRKTGLKISAESTLAVMELMDECRRQMGLVYPQEKTGTE
ncbi:putative oxidoreductase [Alkalibacterium sp. AK22]|uniref:Gfo/Idh/MocA family protein n=1 Tax=Alkalibacterium sp. AK22 TaxID=1229520 RepID=UPI000446E450|nr:Gfo/Idh/MocA family oxidoreductase [Alkalibacterium sp. AK22]EXJ22963.1 putative oxidoreductase [Alkalibacterium sp. AK22]